MSGEYNLILYKPSYSWKLSIHKIIFEQFLEEEIFTNYVLHILGCAIGIGCRYNYHVFYFMTLFFPVRPTDTICFKKPWKLTNKNNLAIYHQTKNTKL